MRIGSLIALLCCMVLVGCETQTETPDQLETPAVMEPGKSEISEPKVDQPAEPTLNRSDEPASDTEN